MGLDIHVNVTAKQVASDIRFCEQITHPETALALLGAIEANSKIHTRPGSYAGLHVVREHFARIHGLPKFDCGFVFGKEQPKEWDPFHLLNHQDCEGWYLPNDFPKPAWLGTISVGSSVRLLNELQEMELERATNPDWGPRWDAVYLAAVASVVTRQPIKFS